MNFGWETTTEERLVGYSMMNIREIWTVHRFKLFGITCFKWITR